MRATRLPRLHVITDTRGPVAPAAHTVRSGPAAREPALEHGGPDTATPPDPARGVIAPSELIVTQRDASQAISSPLQASAPHDVLFAIEAALAAGARLVQVRPEDHYTDRAAFDLATAIAALCDQYGALCLVNDRVHIAEAVGADGVHLGADDLPIDAARRILSAASVIGGTARDPESARAARRAGATYLGVGPVWGTTTKAGLPQPIGLDGLAAVCEAVDLPVIAIGGITAERAALCREAGAHGAAVVGAVSAAADPRRATAELLEALGESPGEWRGVGTGRSGPDAGPRGTGAAPDPGLLRVAGEA
ncbi:thiamine phosphate synthase [Glycomyces luteolus]|uniref:Thiamine-phosphate synthase n=1 Tax=Glycomyces luteolus TaxID=2670330 RepID=A0A9X3PD45_9ACTN|nr:thiamine phosphate synthase [Glycomyces luteolus]MDA1361562.1 thiamine phosphate synthase [Glycomyces luteolus]